MTKTIAQAIVWVLGAANEPMHSPELIRKVQEETGASEGSIRNEFTGLVSSGEIASPRRGYYRLPTAADLGPKSTIDPHSYSYDNVVSYPVMDIGVGAGPALVQQPTEERLVAPQRIVQGWTGGTVPKQNEAYWTKVRGTSMEPWLSDGSPIFVVKCNEVVQGGRYVIYLDDSEAEVVKRLERIGGGILRVISDNPSHSNQTLKHLENDMYRDLEYNVTIRVRVQGVVIYPKDTGNAISGMLSKGGQ